MGGTAAVRARSTPAGPTSSPGTAAAGALPDYLTRYYAWAYLWPPAVWFFDHQPIINLILFGNYRRIMDETLRLLEPASAGRTLQIAAVYGELTPTLATSIEDLHVVDVAPVQVEATRRKLEDAGRTAELALMDAEALDYPDASFDTALSFLLLHEMPRQARRRSLAEAVRILRPGGRLVVAEYGERTSTHPLHRFPPFRWTLTFAEPFLGGFWSESLDDELQAAAGDRRVVAEERVSIFGGFYRVVRYRVE